MVRARPVAPVVALDGRGEGVKGVGSYVEAIVEVLAHFPLGSVEFLMGAYACGQGGESGVTVRVVVEDLVREHESGEEEPVMGGPCGRRKTMIEAFREHGKKVERDVHVCRRKHGLVYGVCNKVVQWRDKYGGFTIQVLEVALEEIGRELCEVVGLPGVGLARHSTSYGGGCWQCG